MPHPAHASQSCVLALIHQAEKKKLETTVYSEKPASAQVCARGTLSNATQR